MSVMFLYSSIHFIFIYIFIFQWFFKKKVESFECRSVNLWCTYEKTPRITELYSQRLMIKRGQSKPQRVNLDIISITILITQNLNFPCAQPFNYEFRDNKLSQGLGDVMFYCLERIFLQQNNEESNCITLIGCIDSEKNDKALFH